MSSKFQVEKAQTFIVPYNSKKMKASSLVIFLVFLSLMMASSCLSESFIIPIERHVMKSDPSNTTSIIYEMPVYTVNITLNDDTPLRMYIDLYEPFVIQFCCASNSSSPNCYVSATCSAGRFLILFD